MLNKTVPMVLLLLLLGFCIWILQPFLLTILWAFIISFVLFPLYTRLNRVIQNDTLSAAFLTTTIAVLLISLTFSLFNLVEDEMKTAYQLVFQIFSESTWQLPEPIRNLPYLGEYLQNNLNRLTSNHATLANSLIDGLKQSSGVLTTFFGSVGQRTIKLGFVFVTVFFCFRDGEQWLQQLKCGLNYFLGESHHLYLQTAGDTTRAVVYGLILAALAQGFVAGIGYFVAGVKMPLLLATVTALLALIPMGATLIWLPTSLMLMINHELFAGLGLLAWGFLAVSTIDNIIRPLVICGASKIPFLVVMFGVFGGLSTFGTIGLFLGPVMLSVLLAVWTNFVNSLSQN
jgi:Ca2+-transporting ATPase